MTPDSSGSSEVEARFFDPLDDELPLSAWQALGDAAADPNPFFGPSFLRPYLRHMGVRRVKVLAVEDRSTGQWLVAAPIQIRPAGLLVPIPAAFTTDYGPVGTPLLHPATVAAHAKRFYEAAAGRTGVLLLPDLPLASKAAKLLMDLDGVTGVVTGRSERASHDGGPEGQVQFDEAFKGKRRKEMKRLLRRLEDEGAVSLVTVEGGAVTDRFEAFLALEASGWKGRENTALVSKPQTAAFSRETVVAAASAGHVRIDELLVGGKLIASLVAFVEGGHVFAWKIAFDESYARYSPGAQLVLDTFQKNLATPGFRLADSLAVPGHSMIEPLWRGRLETGTLLLSSGPLAALRNGICSADLGFEQTVRQMARTIRNRLKS
ncbi:MAG: GNAT family N-acetyltransferase [Roseibium sp.]|uniref:GNAT family N-acetyltransferase n=1 Tax=Roseibium sp. TaxID=1936156 RepID=UPI003D9C4D49